MVTAITGGTITAIAVQPGQHVEPGQVLLQLNDMQEKIELEHLHKELHIQQINRLKNPHDPGAQQQLATIRAQIETSRKTARRAHRVRPPRWDRTRPAHTSAAVGDGG